MSASESMDVTAPTVVGQDVPAGRRRPPPGVVADVVVTVLLLALFGWGFLEAARWSFQAALFPRMVSGTAFVLTALHLVQALLRLRREVADGSVATTADDPGDPDDAEHLFRTAGARRWASTLGWVAGFFVLLYVGGLFVTAPMFSFAYLRLVGRRTWVFSAVYAVVIAVVLYAAFELALGIPTPPGLLLD